MTAQSSPDAQLDLLTERLGPLPLLNHFLDRSGLLEILEKHVDGDAHARRSAVSHAQACSV